MAIFCLILVAVGLAGGAAVYFLHLAPTSSAQNVTDVQNLGSAEKGEIISTGTGPEKMEFGSCQVRF